MTRADTRRILVAYDIIDDRRRSRVAKCLERHGDRVQFSVFVVDGAPARLVRLVGQLRELVDTDVDSLLLCDLGRVAELQSRQFQFIGVSRPMMAAETAIV